MRAENSVLGPEIIAIRTSLQTVQGMTTYELQMMEVQLNTPTQIYGDNISVIHSICKPESTLNKNENLVCYHFIREAVATDECKIGHIATDQNPADVATN